MEIILLLQSDRITWQTKPITALFYDTDNNCFLFINLNKIQVDKIEKIYYHSDWNLTDYMDVVKSFCESEKLIGNKISPELFPDLFKNRDNYYKQRLSVLKGYIREYEINNILYGF